MVQFLVYLAGLACFSALGLSISYDMGENEQTNYGLKISLVEEREVCYFNGIPEISFMKIFSCMKLESRN